MLSDGRGLAAPALRAVGWAVAASLATALTHAVMRAAATDLHPVIVALWRNLVSLALVLPLTVAQGAWRVQAKPLGWSALRGAVNAAAMILLIAGLAITPFAFATTLSFAATPFTLLLAAFLLNDWAHPARILAAIVGLAGVVVVLDPFHGGIGAGGFYILGSALLFAFTVIIGKTQTRFGDNLSILFYLYVFLGLFCLLAALPVWHWPAPGDWPLLLATGGLAVLAHYSLIAALRAGDASLVASFDYLRLLWAVGIGLLFFGETAQRSTLIGAQLIVLAAVIPLFGARRRS